ncbi:MAG: endonuclease III [Acidobacteria bacterium]|nr:endonuclease III [Acidobacteriota bacterium]
MSRKAVAARAAQIVDRLEELYPDVQCALHHDNPLQLLVATILSAQCTDARVNLVTPELFRKFPDAQAFAGARLKELESAIRTTGFFRNKAKNIRECCRAILKRFGGGVPSTLEDLVTLPGVGRKTANVVLGSAFGIPGITVDTHVGRLSRRLGLTKHQDPVKIEFDLMKLIPEEKWSTFSLQLIWHGRRVCHARSPRCGECTLNALCPYPARLSRSSRTPIIPPAP